MVTTSVIIPTLNEEAWIVDSIAHLRRVWPDAEIVVSDGGSTDDTVALAREAADRIVLAETGRGVQMNEGAAEATGELLVFVHADSLLPRDARSQVLQALDQGAQSGTFRLAFDNGSAVLDMLALVTRIPVPGICFGDRGLFVTRSRFELEGGYSEIPIFEDVDLACRLERHGSFVYLEAYTHTSPRRFLRRGAVRQQAVNTLLWLGWLVGVPPEQLKRFYPYRSV